MAPAQPASLPLTGLISGHPQQMTTCQLTHRSSVQGLQPATGAPVPVPSLLHLHFPPTTVPSPAHTHHTPWECLRLNRFYLKYFQQTDEENTMTNACVPLHRFIQSQSSIVFVQIALSFKEEKASPVRPRPPQCPPPIPSLPPLPPEVLPSSGRCFLL